MRSTAKAGMLSHERLAGANARCVNDHVCRLRGSSNMASNVLLALVVLASVAMLCSAIATYIEVWKSDITGEDVLPPSKHSVFGSRWFFYMTVLIGFASMLGLIVLF